MKQKALFLFACLLLVSANPSSTHAAIPVAKEEMRVGIAEKMRVSPDGFAKITDKKTEKRFNRLNKRLTRKMEKAGIQVDFNDPVEQWLWFGLFGLGIAIVLSFFNFGIAGLIAFLALVCLVVWIIKRGAV